MVNSKIFVSLNRNHNLEKRNDKILKNSNYFRKNEKLKKNFYNMACFITPNWQPSESITSCKIVPDQRERS